MPKAIKEIFTSEVSIVLIGDFNPIVFQPAWFSNQELLRASEAEKAEVSIIHPDISSFTTEWLSLQVTRDRFTAITKSEPHIPHLRDFVVGTFNKLEHTPVAQMGLNCTRSLVFRSDADWHNFGHFMAPKSPWKAFEKPGLLSLTMRSERSDKDGFVTTTIAQGEKNHILVKVNDHYENLAGAKLANAAAYIDLIEENFEASLAMAERLVTALTNKFEEQGVYDGGS
jgi:hypothetical protein